MKSGSESWRSGMNVIVCGRFLGGCEDWDWADDADKYTYTGFFPAPGVPLFKGTLTIDLEGGWVACEGWPKIDLVELLSGLPRYKQKVEE